MIARILIGMFLMAASNSVSWYMIYKSSSSSLSVLRSVVWKIALFYVLWALYNRYPGGRDGELGHFSFGILVLTCLGTAYFVDETNNTTKQLWTRVPLAIACGLVVLNFSIVVPMIVSSGGPFGIARLIWNEESLLVNVWGLAFLFYIASNVILWSYCGYLFFKLPLVVGDDRGYTTPTIDTVEYQPIETADV